MLRIVSGAPGATASGFPSSPVTVTVAACAAAGASATVAAATTAATVFLPVCMSPALPLRGLFPKNHILAKKLRRTRPRDEVGPWDPI